MLKQGARIAVVAPAGRFDKKRLTRGMNILREWEYQLVPGPNLNAAHRYFAGTSAQRIEDLTWAMTDPEIDAVWFARGGYGTVQVLDDLPWDDMDDRPVIGFSDATAMFAAMSVRGKGHAIHAPVIHSLADHVDEISRRALKIWMRSGTIKNFPGKRLCGHTESVEGEVVGGNLCVLTSLAGTQWQLNAKDRILLLEDVGEAPYRIDRMITQLMGAGAFDGVRGIALGTFYGCEAPNDAGWSLGDILRERLSPLNVPVVAGMPVGHGPNNLPWRVGAHARLQANGLMWTDA
ncbi:MAG: LD-carboxypeptidase [Myxococcota bacterium]|nr:LD-carboxypeptidase [Myxococcota bacterium]